MAEKRILVVDDDELYASSLRRALAYQGKYDVSVVTNPKDVLDELHRFKPHAVVLDMMMPRIGGLDVCAMMNEDPIGKVTPIVILTGLQKESDRLLALTLGVQKYISKLLPIDEVVATVESVMLDIV
jgi:two-component system response regulator MprA